MKHLPACVWFCVLRELFPCAQQERSKHMFLITVLLSEAKAIGRSSSHVSFEGSTNLFFLIKICLLFAPDLGTVDDILTHISAVIPFVSQPPSSLFLKWVPLF